MCVCITLHTYTHCFPDNKARLHWARCCGTRQRDWRAEAQVAQHTIVPVPRLLCERSGEAVCKTKPEEEEKEEEN